MKKTFKGIIVAAIVIMTAFVMSACGGGKTIDVAQFVSYQIQGSNGKGKLVPKFDETKFEAAVREAVNDDQKLLGMALAMGNWDPASDGTWNKTANLSNGDKISWKWSGNEDRLKQYGIRLKGTPIEVTVDGLKDLESYDYFSELVVKFKGVEPSGELELDVSGVQIPDLYAEADKSKYLKNGDEVILTVKARSSSLDDHLEKYGYEIQEVSRKYTVSGLGSYALKMEDIEGSAMLEKMNLQAEDIVKAHVANGWVNKDGLKEMNLLGFYLLQPKPFFVEKLSNNDFSNKLVLVYRVEAEAIGDGDNKVPFTYYYYTEFTNIVKETDGNFTYDLTNYTVPEGSMSWGSIYGEAVSITADSKSYYVQGFSTLEELFSVRISSNLEKYSYETTVK